MRKQKWSNFFGAIGACTALSCVAVCARHVQKKFGEKPGGFSIDYRGIAEYAFDKFVLNNEKLLLSIGDKLENDKNNTETEQEQ